MLCTIQSQLIIFARTYVTHLKHKVAKTFFAPAFLLFGVVNFNRCFTRNTENPAAPKEMVPWATEMRRCRDGFIRRSQVMGFQKSD